MGHTYTKTFIVSLKLKLIWALSIKYIPNISWGHAGCQNNIYAVYLKFRFNWTPCIFYWLCLLIFLRARDRGLQGYTLLPAMLRPHGPHHHLRHLLTSSYPPV